MMKQYTLQVNGLDIQASYDEENMGTIFIPLVKKMDTLQKKQNKRLIVFLAGPPAIGKSTLTLLLESLAIEMHISMQCIGMDGFHYHNSYLTTNTIVKEGKEILLKDIKGSIYSYDIDKLTSRSTPVDRVSIG